MIDRLNSIDEALTIGTLPDYAVVAPKDLVATIKIIPFAVPGTGADRGGDVGAAGSPADAASVPPLRCRAGG
jgi:molybdenum cofactor cytidylyltransferase